MSVMRCSLASGTVLNGSVSACILEIPCTCGCGPCSAQVLVIWQIYRKFVMSQYLSFAACLPCGFLFCLSLFSTYALFLFLSLSLIHGFSYFLVLSLSLVLFFLFLSLAIPFLFSPGNYSGSGNLFLSFLYSLSLVLFLSFSLSVIVVGGERGSVIGEGEKSE